MPGIRRPVRMITWPSSASRRIRLGEPTSSLPSGVTVAALIDSFASRMASAAWSTTAFSVLAAVVQRQVEPLQLDVDADHVAVQQPQRLLQQLLAGLVALQGDDAKVRHVADHIPDRCARCSTRAGPRPTASWSSGTGPVPAGAHRGLGAARRRARRDRSPSRATGWGTRSWTSSSRRRSCGPGRQPEDAGAASPSSSRRSSIAAITVRRCSSKSTPSSSAADADLVAVDRRGEGRRLQLLLHRLRRHALDAGGPHQGAGGHEAAELVDGVQGLGHLGLARDAQVGRVAGHGVDQLLRIVQLLEQLQRHARVAGLQVRVLLVVQVVQDAGGGPQLLVLRRTARA